ncbi:histidine kinase dimerization/phospho-acceptor domain-containing protein [Xanthocytophaga agilis]|uniref:histidine kinase n=1 Tax=Xanthocytophaga agilis TaxID=3048010 RepID=A0AAE3UJV9_9BACT|nr:histidine kinase dimerization/phospho-acceptor domain-containing protein [Xanthocytophaga agilis]MDJ1506627.1 histidine kinase dimerization/phospho-acceptor domain-containing protein [Xanthocytophaga agilis]
MKLNWPTLNLRKKAAVFFAAAFLVLWSCASFLFFQRLKKTLYATLDGQLKARATIVTEKTSLHPKIVPLPQNNESFLILYQHTDFYHPNLTDTVFKPVSLPFTVRSDSAFSENHWRVIRQKTHLENRGYLIVVYGVPANAVEEEIRSLTCINWLLLVCGFLLSLVVANWLTGRLLSPLQKVIALTQAINFKTITLLDDPSTKDEINDLVVSFNRMLLRIKEQSDKQTAFFASASHELRTPLSVMQTRLQVWLQSEAISPEIKSLFEQQLTEVKRMTKMTNDFLLLSQLKSGQILTTGTVTNLSDLVAVSLTYFKSKADQKNTTFKIEYSSLEADWDVVMDAEKTTIIVNNLLENAIKYSPDKEKITIRFEQSETRVMVCIENYIHADINPVMADLKNEFYHSKPLDGEGFGLGLWIANQLATIQQMSLELYIQNGCFQAWLSIPVTKSENLIRAI